MEVAGKTRTLKFGMRCSKFLAAHYKSLKKAETAGGAEVDDLDQLALFFWAALKAKESENDLPEGFNLSMALDWMDDLSSEQIEIIMAMGGECMGFISKFTELLNDQEKRQEKLQNYQMQGSKKALAV